MKCNWGGGLGRTQSKKISRTRWIDSIRIRLKFGLIDVTYINTDSDADREKYAVFTQFDDGKFNNASYRYRANLLPTTLAADDSSGGVKVKMTFERHIVWPDGRKEIEGVSPKLITDASHALPSDVSSTQHARDMENKDELAGVRHTER